MTIQVFFTYFIDKTFKHKKIQYSILIREIQNKSRRGQTFFLFFFIIWVIKFEQLNIFLKQSIYLWKHPERHPALQTCQSSFFFLILINTFSSLRCSCSLVKPSIRSSMWCNISTVDILACKLFHLYEYPQRIT